MGIRDPGEGDCILDPSCVQRCLIFASCMYRSDQLVKVLCSVGYATAMPGCLFALSPAHGQPLLGRGR